MDQPVHGGQAPAGRYLAAATAIVVWAAAGCSFDYGRVWTDGGSTPPPPDIWAPPPPDHDVNVRHDQGNLPRPDAGLPPDLGRPPDSSAPPPPLCWRDTAGAMALCPLGWAAIAGGTRCAVGDWIGSTRPRPTGDGWSSACTLTTTPSSTKVVCAQSGQWQITQNSGSGKLKVACPAGLKVLGGGCSCGATGAVFDSSYEAGNEAWRCGCDPAGADVAHAVCAASSTAASLGRSLNSTDQLGSELSAPCTSGHILAGGCESVLQWVFRSDSNFGNPHNRWDCGVGDNLLAVGKARALCVQPVIGACP